MTVDFITREHCHLCDEAEAMLAGLAGRLGLAVRAVDVDADPELLAEFGARVPVARAGGVVLAEGKWDRRRLRRRLRRLARRRGTEGSTLD